MYDVIVIGAGPIGSYTANRLAQLGYRVAVLEKNETIGSKVCCTGIISKECYDSFSVASNLVIKAVNSAKLFTPSGNHIRLEKDGVQAYIIDRAALDVSLANKAKEANADYLLKAQVTDIIPGKNSISVRVNHPGQRQMLEARAIVITCGFGSSLPQRLGLGRISPWAFGVQAEVNTNSISEVELYFDQEIAPGFFAWLVPIASNRVLAGLLSRHSPFSYINKLMTKLCHEGKINHDQFEIRQKMIPLKPLAKTYGDRVLVVGEAAGQVKPTTGGGIYFGLLSAEIAVKTLHKALQTDNLSSSQLCIYQKDWQTKIGRDLQIGYWARNLYSKLNNRQIDRIFDTLVSNRIHEQLLSGESFSFDWHSKLISQALTRPRLLVNLITIKPSFFIPYILVSERLKQVGKLNKLRKDETTNIVQVG